MNTRSQIELFVSERKDSWDELSLLSSQMRKTKPNAFQISRQTELFRQVCRDLVRAQHLGCAPTTLSYLDTLVSRTHSQVYAGSGTHLLRSNQSFFRAFPQALRANGKLLFFANILFWLPFIVCLNRSLDSEIFAMRVVPVDMLKGMAQAYQGPLGEGRTGGSNTAMAGFYVFNNIGIAFRCFATGILFGLGSVFFLIHNGAVTGTVVGYVIRVGNGANILTFISGHAPLELGAIVISGAAGLQMGRALVVTEGRTRLASLGANRDAILTQILGAALMLLGAALIEGFWSPSSAPAPIKWATAAVFVVLTVLYFGFVGKTALRPSKTTHLTLPHRGTVS